MVEIRKFRGLRARHDIVCQVAAPPYDVVSRGEARLIASGNPYSFLHIGKPEIDLPEEVGPYDDRVYQKGREAFLRFEKEKILIRDNQKNLYAYQQNRSGRSQTGIVAAANIQDYLDNRIRRHELTRPDKENDRVRHIDAINAQTGPSFLFFRSRRDAVELLNEITESFEMIRFTATDEVEHRFWVLPTFLSDRLISLFSEIETLYIADGHHRTAAASRVRRLRLTSHPNLSPTASCNFFLSVIFSHEQLTILPYNRAITDLNGNTPDQLIGKLKQRADVCRQGQPVYPDKAGVFGLFLDGAWYRLSLSSEHLGGNGSDPSEHLDVSRLHRTILEPILGIGDERTDARIQFVGGIRGTMELEKLVASGAAAAAFSLFPTTVEQLMAVADSEGIMPPKSTWFEPKLRDGLVSLVLDENL